VFGLAWFWITEFVLARFHCIQQCIPIIIVVEKLQVILSAVSRVMSMMGGVREQLQQLWYGHLVQCFFSPVLNLTPAPAPASVKSEPPPTPHDYTGSIRNPYQYSMKLLLSVRCQWGHLVGILIVSEVTSIKYLPL